MPSWIKFFLEQTVTHIIRSYSNANCLDNNQRGIPTREYRMLFNSPLFVHRFFFCVHLKCINKHLHRIHKVMLVNVMAEIIHSDLCQLTNSFNILHQSNINRCSMHYQFGVSWDWCSITVTSKWARWRLKSPASQLFTQPFIQRTHQRKHQSSASLAFFAVNSPVTMTWTHATNNEIHFPNYGIY